MALQFSYAEWEQHRKEVGHTLWHSDFMQKKLPKVLETCKDSKLFVREDCSSNFCIGDYSVPEQSQWFRMTMRDNARIRRMIEASDMLKNSWTNLTYLEFAYAMEWTFVRRGNSIHVGWED